MNLKSILKNIKIKLSRGNLDRIISGISENSLEIKKNNLFFAVKGNILDGHQFIEDAISKGCTVVVCTDFPVELNDNITYIKVENIRKSISIISLNFYNNPSDKIKVITVTGTNGKTSVVYFLYQFFRNMNLKVGMLSTIENRINDTVLDTNLTTPSAITVNSLLNDMVLSGCEYCIMEVSSHAIDQDRIYGLIIDIAILTNISHDHLDYHKNFKNYRDTKKSFFDNLSKESFALTNIDDKNGIYMLQNTKAKKYTLSINKHANFNLKISENLFSGMLLNFENYEFWTKLVGKFNAFNILTVIAVSKIFELNTISVLKKISKMDNVNGRFQIFNSKKSIKVIIDYAHTPIALENVLNTINEIRTKNENIITVIGCGGNRDKKKRPIIGKKAALLSDKVILTSDNPRNENPKKIIEDMIKGVSPSDFKKIIKVTDREKAIMESKRISQPGDIILIAGKGHENYQEIKGKRNPFDDYEIVKKYF